MRGPLLLFVCVLAIASFHARALAAQPARMLADLQGVEIAATGTGDQTKAMTTSARAHELIRDGAGRDERQRLEAAFNHASTETWEVDQYGRQGRMVGRIGLHADGAANVRFAVQQTEKLAPAAAELWKVTQTEKLKRDAEIAQTLYNRALYILDYPYNGRRPGRPFAPRAPSAR